jgi:hypothetical protein
MEPNFIQITVTGLMAITSEGIHQPIVGYISDTRKGLIAVTINEFGIVVPVTKVQYYAWKIYNQ